MWHKPLIIALMLQLMVLLPLMIYNITIYETENITNTSIQVVGEEKQKQITLIYINYDNDSSIKCKYIEENMSIVCHKEINKMLFAPHGPPCLDLDNCLCPVWHWLFLFNPHINETAFLTEDTAYILLNKIIEEKQTNFTIQLNIDDIITKKEALDQYGIVGNGGYIFGNYTYEDTCDTNEQYNSTDLS